MAPARPRTCLALLVLAAFLLAVPTAQAASGISDAIALGGKKTTSVKTGGGGSVKEALAVVTASPVSGQTVSGTVKWGVEVTAGAPSRVEFLVDGSPSWTQTSAPYLYGGNGALDTTRLANGSHTLSAVAYGARGAKATTAVTVNVSNATETPLEATPEAGPGGPIYWGATIGSQLTGEQAPWDMSAVTKFEEETRKNLSLVQFFMPFANCSSTCTYYSFPKTPMENVRQHGSIPVLSWSSASIPTTREESNFQLADVIDGSHDAYIKKFAEAAKAWGHPFFLRFDWEMNGNWFPWSEGVNGNKPGEFVAAWRHVHDIFAAVGATNATWVWCPNIDPGNSYTNLASLYPGDAYVDWTGLDGYNWGTNPVKPQGWKTFDQLFRSTYNNVVGNVAPSKPMLIGEVASSEDGGSKAAWIKEMLAKVPAEYKAIRGLLWFDTYADGMDWPLETSETSTDAFAEAIQNTDFVGNTLTELTASAVQPLN